MEPRIVHTLTRGDSIGLTIATEAGLISLIAVCAVFGIMFRNIYLQIRSHPTTWRLIQEPMDLYMLSLFLAGLVQSSGTVLDIRWIERGQVVAGTFCTVQGTLQQLGETGVAMTTLVMAIHTFVAIWWRKGVHALRAAKIIMGVVWLYIILFVGIGIGLNRKDDYIVPTPYWCWIGSDYLLERIFGEYLWLWLTLVFSFLTYIPLYFCCRGNIIVRDDVWWKFSVCRVQVPDPNRLRALGLIAYPLAYSVLILPHSIVRWLGFRAQAQQQQQQYGPAPAGVFAVAAIYALSGAANAALLLTTRPNLLLFKRDPFVASSLGRAPIEVPPMVMMNAPLGAGARHSLRLEGLGSFDVGSFPDMSKIEHGWDKSSSIAQGHS